MTPTSRLRQRLRLDCNMHPEVAAMAVNVVMDELRQLLIEEPNVTLLNIGRFEHQFRQVRKAQNFAGSGVHKPGGVIVPARMELKFYPCPEVVSAVALQTPSTAS